MKSITKMTVELGERSYPIFIGESVLTQVDYLLPYLTGKQIFVVTNETVAKWYLQPLTSLIESARPDLQIDSLALADGEQFKSLQTIEQIFTGLLQRGHTRKTTIIALGGGVVGDMAGFAAACYQRGVPFVQIPTTLLSQVDSSVGGKTGVNHPLGKNMIGAFYQPQAVLIDLSVLKTLPDRELSAGMAEVIKYGLIADAEFMLWLEQNMDRLMSRDTQALQYAIHRSCEIKAEVVTKDEREGGLRAILNLGHTYGHAIETEMGYGVWLHGEAVAAGMVMACDLSVRLGWLEESVKQRAVALLERANLPIEVPKKMTGDAFRRLMKVDKKVLDGRVRLVLLKGCGNAVVTDEFDDSVFQQQLNEC